MKLKGAQVGAFLKKPDPAARVVLVYGPDSGQVQEAAATLARHVVPDLTDPFRVTDLTPAVLKTDPARLADETAALSLTGGRRVVRIRDGDDSLTALLKSFLANPVGEALVVLAAGDLATRSTLRKLCEDAVNAAAVPCYGDTADSLDTVIRETLRPFGLMADDEAMAYLCGHLGGDRLLTRRELERLALYALNTPGGRVTLDDVMACIGDSTALSLDDLAFATADGAVAAADRLLDRLIREGTSPVGILRTMMRHFQRLHLAAGAVAAGQSPDQAMKALRPAVFFKYTDRFRTQLRTWSLDRLARAMEILVDAELDCKSTGMPDEEICSQALSRIARAARVRRTR
ncbi:MAG: DNA polymerase III subunit delta [Alphaproteobacteria bacterium]